VAWDNLVFLEDNDDDDDEVVDVLLMMLLWMMIPKYKWVSIDPKFLKTVWRKPKKCGKPKPKPNKN